MIPTFIAHPELTPAEIAAHFGADFRGTIDIDIFAHVPVSAVRPVATTGAGMGASRRSLAHIDVAADPTAMGSGYQRRCDDADGPGLALPGSSPDRPTIADNARLLAAFDPVGCDAVKFFQARGPVPCYLEAGHSGEHVSREWETWS